MKTMNVKMILGALVVVTAILALGFFAIKVAVNEHLQELQLETKVTIEKQVSLLTSIAEITARNGADELTESIIKDCSVTERTRFDELLSGLDRGLSKTNLVELERLFGRCGSFYAERKSIMVARMSRELEVLSTLVNQLSVITGNDVSGEYKIQNWKELTELEQKQSELFSSLVSMQDSIITALLSGEPTTSEEITSILKEVNTTQQTLGVIKTQAATVRSTLVPL